MARFDVYRNAGPKATATPFLLDVQADLLDGLDTRVVIPLRRLDRFPNVRLPDRLLPVLQVDGQAHLLETPKLAAVPKRLLGERVTTLIYERDRITASLDFLMQGY